MPETLRRPTALQSAFMQAITRHRSAKDAMLDAGYSKSAAKHPRKVIQAIAKTTLADELVEVGLHDKFLAEHCKDALEAERTVNVGGGMTATEPDWFARHKYFNSICLIRGIGTTTRVEHTGMVGVNVKAMLMGAFKLMGKSAGIKVDEEALEVEIARMSGQGPENAVEIPDAT